MAMKHLRSLMLKKWKDKERWTGRRRSEPFGGRDEEEEEERRTYLRHRLMLRRKSEPCGQMEDDGKTEEKKKSDRRKERRKSEPNVEEENRRERMRTDRGKERRKSTSFIVVEDQAGGQADKRRREIDRKTLRRRSEPSGVLHLQLLPLSFRKRRELLLRRTGRRTSCSEEADGQMNRRRGDGEMTRGTSEPIGPLDHSKAKHYEHLTQMCCEWYTM